MPVIADPTPDWMKNSNPNDSIFLKGLRAAGNLMGGSDPNSVMSVGIPMPVPSGQALGGALGSIGGNYLSNITPDLVQAGKGAAQHLPSGSDVEALTGMLKHNLAKIPQAGAKAAQGALQGLGKVSQEYTPVGAEDIFNSTRPTFQPWTRPPATSGIDQQAWWNALTPAQKLLQSGK